VGKNIGKERSILVDTMKANSYVRHTESVEVGFCRAQNIGGVVERKWPNDKMVGTINVFRGVEGVCCVYHQVVRPERVR